MYIEAEIVIDECKGDIGLQVLLRDAEQKNDPKKQEYKFIFYINFYLKKVFCLGDIFEF